MDKQLKIGIDENLHKKFKKKCVDKNSSMRQVLLYLINKWTK